MLKECKKHGMVEHVEERSGYMRCKKCRSAAVTKARRERKRKLVEEAGGQCEICGYNTCLGALQFHHLDPADKAFGIGSRGVTRKLEAQLDEIKKCVLLCANCHAEAHETSED